MGYVTNAEVLKKISRNLNVVLYYVMNVGTIIVIIAMTMNALKNFNGDSHERKKNKPILKTKIL